MNSKKTPHKKNQKTPKLTKKPLKSTKKTPKHPKKPSSTMIKYLLCCPLLRPHIVGTGLPPVTRKKSVTHWPLLSGGLISKVSKSTLTFNLEIVLILYLKCTFFCQKRLNCTQTHFVCQIISIFFILVLCSTSFEHTWQMSLFILLIIKLQILCEVGGLVKYVAFSEVVLPQLNSTRIESKIFWIVCR